MDLDEDKIADAVLVLLHVGLRDGVVRAWKGFDWEALDRLHETGMIENPRCKAKSAVFTDEGLRRSKELLEAMLGRAG